MVVDTGQLEARALHLEGQTVVAQYSHAELGHALGPGLGAGVMIMVASHEVDAVVGS